MRQLHSFERNYSYLNLYAFGVTCKIRFVKFNRQDPEELPLPADIENRGKIRISRGRKRERNFPIGSVIETIKYLNKRFNLFKTQIH